MSTILRAALSGTLLAGCGVLAGCNQPSGSNASAPMATNSAAALPGLPASLPLQGGPATTQVAAPAVSRLPDAPRPALRQLADPDAGYAYLDRAASWDDAMGDAPPDYAFGYDGVTPWGWQADDGAVEYAEPIDGGYRYYYYQPGADTPYLVRDPYYSYAFDGGALVVVYDHAGRMVPRGDYGPRWDYAGRFLARAQALRAAAQADRRQVVAANWAARRAQIAASDAAWDAARARDAAWAAYHERTADRERAHWQDERDARAQAAQRFAAFQQQGFRGPPPGAGQPVRAAAPQGPAAAPAGGPDRQRVVADRAQAAAAAHQANRPNGPQQPVGAPHAAAGPARGDQARAAFREPPAGAPRQPDRSHPGVEHGQPPRADRGAPRQTPRAAERTPAAAPHAQREAPREERQAPARAAPPRAEAPRMAAPRAAPAPRSEPPRAEAPHAAPAARPAQAPRAAPPHAAAPHAGPPAGGEHEHH